MMFWVIISCVLAVTLFGARRFRGVDTGHILYRWQDIMGVAAIGGMICMLVLKITLG